MFCLVLLVATVGCFPSTKVIKNPGSHDKGIRYYRPKPYLFIKPHVNKELVASDDVVDIQLQMLPDFTEEYSIHIRSGVGTNATNVALDQGWNLTSINVDIDSKFNENVSAITEGISKFVPTEGDGVDAGAGRAVVRATNVPLGYYESVITRGSDGCKRMYGWRYIGFSPYAYCPQEVCGVECQTNCEHRELYGLVFENGVMTFKQLIDARYANNTRSAASGRARAVLKFQNEISRLVPEILAEKGISGVSNKDVDITIEDTSEDVIVSVSLDAKQMEAYREGKANLFDIGEAISNRVLEETQERILFKFSVDDKT